MDRPAALALSPTLPHAAALTSWRLPARARPGSTTRRPVARAGCRAETLPELDHHAEAGAPEGALYVDGVLFGFSGAR